MPTPPGSLERWIFALDAAETGVWDLSLNGGRSWHSPLHDQIFGYTEAQPEWTYPMFFQHVVEEDRGHVLDAFQRAMAERGDWSAECRIRRPDGEIRWITLNSRIEADDQQRPARMWGTIRDVTERKRTELALHETDGIWRELAEAMPQLVWIAGADGAAQFYNSRVSNYFGIRQQPDGTWNWEVTVHPEDTERTLNAWRDAVAAGTPYACEHRIRMANGEYRWHLTRAVPHHRQSEVRQWFGTATDVHELKLKEEALQEAGRKKNEFLATLAHELRNPLAPIQSGIDILTLRPGDAQTGAQVATMMQRQMRHLKHLVDDLLDVARISQGSFQLRREVLDLRTVVQETVEVASPGERELFLELAPEPLMVSADPVRLVQIVGNLLDNAIKFTHDTGRITVTVERRGNSARMAVADDGVGIAPDLLDRVFERFFQSEPHTCNNGSGLGIGLWLVRELVELHDGTIEAQSDGLEHGSTLITTLPLQNP